MRILLELKGAILTASLFHAILMLYHVAVRILAGWKSVGLRAFVRECWTLCGLW